MRQGAGRGDNGDAGKGFRGRARPGLLRLLLALLVLVLLPAAASLWWLHAPLALRSDAVELSIERGTPVKGIAAGWVAAGVDEPAWALYAWFRVSGQSRQIRAGSYAALPGTTPRQLLQRMVRGDENLETVRFIEGWTFRQVRAALAAAPGLKQTLHTLDDRAVMSELGSPELPAEGWFFPDTYLYGKGVRDITVLRQAHEAMKRRLEQAWEARAPNLPLKSPADVLVLASIVEKETGRASDRGLIAGVFVNRLRIGMPLQTDPTVIYGLGSAFDGNLRRRDLQADTPFNTYTRNGLPPHAIALPGAASLQAAVKPADTKALYFVARGDGSSEFSQTLDDHNRAVWRYQKMRPSSEAGNRP